MSPSSIFSLLLLDSISTISKEAGVIKHQFSRPKIENMHQEHMFLLGLYVFNSGEILFLPYRERKKKKLFLLMSGLDHYHIEQGFRVLGTKSNIIIIHLLALF